jgi:hypothetical protein
MDRLRNLAETVGCFICSMIEAGDVESATVLLFQYSNEYDIFFDGEEDDLDDYWDDWCDWGDDEPESYTDCDCSICRFNSKQ